MNVTEMLQIADRLVFSQTGKHLDDIQEAVIKGVWQGHTYEKIADECDRSESRIRDAAYKLWRTLSEELNEEIHKSNFRSTLERLQLTSSPIIIQNDRNFNFCSYPQQSTNNQCQHRSDQKFPYYDLKQAPKITHCYGRNNEISNLYQWLENSNTNIISVLGIAGIGKTTLVKYFLDINHQPFDFDVIIWKNLKLASLDFIITDILNNIQPNDISQNVNNILNQFLDLLNQNRCLIILDCLEEIFTPQQFANHYQTAYNNTFLQMITEMEHQSCFIFISQEKCQEIIPLEKETYPNKHCLELAGLGESARQIFKDLGLKDEESWSNIINLYEGNPQYLLSIGSLIKEVLNGKASEFIQEELLILTEEIKSSLNELYQRLSPIEQQIIVELSRYEQAVSKEDLEKALSLSLMDLMNGLQSLRRRYLIKTISVDSIKFNLSPVFREYVINCV
jgi:hypothetical protein